MPPVVVVSFLAIMIYIGLQWASAAASPPDATNRICPACNLPITPSSTDLSHCLACGTIHHLKCWQSAPHCRQLGCQVQQGSVPDSRLSDNAAMRTPSLLTRIQTGSLAREDPIPIAAPSDSQHAVSRSPDSRDAAA